MELLYYHARDISQVSASVVRREWRKKGLDEIDQHFETAYCWMAKKVGFNPVFLSLADIRMTGYQWQFAGRGVLEEEKTAGTKKGRESKVVLFAFKELVRPHRFTDYEAWHIVLNDIEDGKVKESKKRTDSLVFKPSYDEASWKRLAKKRRESVQVVVPEIDLRKASQIWCRSKAVKQELTAMGFDEEKIVVKRIPVEEPSLY